MSRKPKLSASTVLPAEPEAELVHGARNIAAILGCSERRARHLIDRGAVPGMVEMDGKLTLVVPVFRAAMRERAAIAAAEARS